MFNNTFTCDRQEAENFSDDGCFYGVDEAESFNISTFVSLPAFKDPAAPEGSEFWTLMSGVARCLLAKEYRASSMIFPG